MEALFAVGIAALGAFASYGFKLIGSKLFLSKYGSLVSKTFAILDPLAGDLIKSYDDSTFQQAAQLIVARIADSNIDEADVMAVTKFVLDKFNPSLAASKVLDPTSEEGQASIDLSNSIKALADGASFDELVTVARKTTALI
jgi:hypothetical protein